MSPCTSSTKNVKKQQPKTKKLESCEKPFLNDKVDQNAEKQQTTVIDKDINACPEAQFEESTIPSEDRYEEKKTRIP